jgi:hypothetical protein
MWFTRLRHRKGFGIHSPFAYQTVGEVIAPPSIYTYYAIPHLFDECEKKRVPDSTRRMADILFRWCARHNVTTARVTPSLHPILKECIKAANSQTRFTTITPQGESAILVTAKSDLFIEDLLQIMTTDDAPVVLGIGYPGEFISQHLQRDKGILFYSRREILFIPYAKTAYVKYDIEF